MNEKIRVLVIYEILGRPKEHIETTLEQLLDRIGENPGLKINSRKVHPAHPVDEEKLKDVAVGQEIFSTFAEVEIELDNLQLLFSLVLNTLPSNIEVIEPSELSIKNFDLSGIVSDLAVKLHRYDEVTKSLLMEKNKLVNVIGEMNKIIKDLGGKSPVEIVEESESAEAHKK